MFQPLPLTKKYIAKSLMLCIVFHLCLGISGQSTGRVTPKINLSAKNVTITDVFKAIKSQTGKIVWFMNEEVNADKKVNVNFENATLDEVMKTLFGASSNFTWSFDEDKVILRKKKDNPDNVVIPNVEPSSVRVDSLPSTITVSGKVTDEKGSPIIGATVVVKGTRVGTTTGVDGGFVLEGVKPKGILTVTSISYLSKDVPLQGKSSVGSIILKEFVKKLDEAVVVAYGITTPRLNTGNVVSIKLEDIEKQPVNNPLYALQGRVPGLQITPTSGLAGSAVNLQIRGKNSLSQQSNPLIVVDGLPILNNISGVSGGDYSGINQISTMSFINPHDIESIDILKDADATSIYGSRGANGVIIITTKKGKDGQTTIDINAQSGWANVSKKVAVLNTQQYLTLRKEAFSNSGIDFINTFPYGVPEYKYIVAPDLFIWDQNRSTDWQKELIGGTAKYQDLQGSISGGNSNIHYLIGGNYHKETTVFPGDNADIKGSAHISLTGSSPNQNFKAVVSASYMSDLNSLPGIDFTTRAITLSPNAPEIYNANGELNWEPLPSGEKSWDNPLYNIKDAFNSKINNLIANADISYRIYPFLSLKTQIGYNALIGNSFKIVNPFFGRPPAEINTPGFSYFRTNESKNISVEPQINYNTHISRGTLDALIGGSIQNTVTASEQLGAYGFTSDALFKNLASATNFVNVSNTSSQYKYCAVFGRLSYNWDNKYLLNLTVRRDGSSRFGPGHQFGNFSSIGTAWIFTQEKFMKAALPFISFGKIRFSYGSSGNDGIGDYAYLERYEPIDGGAYQGTKGYRTLGLFNNYYAWEITRKMEFGLETGFLKDKILFVTSYFRNRSDNQLLNYPYPSMVGPGSGLFNLPALIQNTGIEFSLNTENLKRNNFTWSTSVNLTINRNKLISYPNLEISPYYKSYEINKPFAGVTKAFNFSTVDPSTGKYQFTDISGKNTFSPEDPTRLDNGRYLRVMTDPKFYGGISNSFTYKHFSLDVFFQFTKQMGINPLLGYTYSAGFLGNVPKAFLSRWQKPGDIAEIQKLYFDSPNDYKLAIDRLQESSFSYLDASFIRLKNLSLSYNVPKLWRQKTKLSSNIRIYLQGQNLLTITKYKGLDPETQSMNSLPPLRVFTAGINLTL